MKGSSKILLCIAIVIGIGVVVISAAFYDNLFGQSCPLRSCRLSSIMSSVVFVQSEIETRAIATHTLNDVGKNIQAPQSKYSTFTYVTLGGSIIVEDKSVGFIAVFDPTIVKGHVSWRCSAQPDVVLDTNNPSNIADCGEKYRKLLPGK